MSPARIGNVLAELGITDQVLDLEGFDADNFVIVMSLRDNLWRLSIRPSEILA